MNHILVATDFTPEAEAGIRFSQRLFESLGIEHVKLSLVTVIERLEKKKVKLQFTRAVLESHGLHDESHAEAVAELNRLKDEYFGQSQVETLVLRSSKPVHTTLLEFAENQDVDLMILSHRRQSTVEHLILGSVLEKVLREAHCPVIVVPTESCLKE